MCVDVFGCEFMSTKESLNNHIMNKHEITDFYTVLEQQLDKDKISSDTGGQKMHLIVCRVTNSTFNLTKLL